MESAAANVQNSVQIPLRRSFEGVGLQAGSTRKAVVQLVATESQLAARSHRDLNKRAVRD